MIQTYDSNERVPLCKVRNIDVTQPSLFTLGFLKSDSCLRNIQDLECQNLANVCAANLWCKSTLPGEANLRSCCDTVGCASGPCDVDCFKTKGNSDLWAGANNSAMYPFYSVPLIYDQTNLAQAYKYPVRNYSSNCPPCSLEINNCRSCVQHLKIV